MVGLRKSVKGQHRYRAGRPESRARGRSSSASTSTRHSFSTGEKTRGNDGHGAPGESLAQRWLWEGAAGRVPSFCPSRPPRDPFIRGAAVVRHVGLWP